MKRLSLMVSLILAVPTIVPISAGTLVLHENSSYNLTNGSGSNPLTNISGSGTLISIGCVVTSAVSGNQYLEFGIVPWIDGSIGHTIQVYDGNDNDGYPYFDASIAPYSGGATKGLAVGDSFVINLGVPYTKSLKITPSWQGSAATAGSLTCTAFHT